MERKLLMQILGERLLTTKLSHELLESYVNVAVNNGIYNDLFKHLMDNGASKELFNRVFVF